MADRVAKGLSSKYGCILGEGQINKRHELGIDDPVANLLNRYFTVSSPKRVIDDSPGEGQWLFSGAKSVGVYPVSIDPRARFEYYIDHMVNQFYLGCETPLPRLFSTPGFTEASARAALDLQDMLIKPVQRYIKRQVEK